MHVSPAGLLQPLPIPKNNWTDISMDFIEGLPRSQGYNVIFVVVDCLSKYSHFLPLAHPYIASTVAKLFLDNIFKLHGMPLSIVSDRDPVFTSSFCRQLFKSQGIQPRHSSAYHPQTDGQTEVVNRCLENYLHCFVGNRPKDWMKSLSLAEWWYNSSQHSATGISPYEVVYGYPPHRLISYVKGTTRVAAVEEHLKDREQITKLLKENLQAAQQRMKNQADLHRPG